MNDAIVQNPGKRLAEAEALVARCEAAARVAHDRACDLAGKSPTCRILRGRAVAAAARTLALARRARDAARDAVIAALDFDDCHGRIATLAAAGMWPDDRLADDLRAAIETGMYSGADIYAYAAAAREACARDDASGLDRMRRADVADWPGIAR